MENYTEMSQQKGKVQSLQNQMLLLYLVLITAATLVYGSVHARYISDWSISDWAINYRGGFVRRGIVGALVLPVSAVTRIPLNWLLSTVEFGFYAFIFWGSYRLLSNSAEHSIWTWAAVLSPATFSFQLVDVGGGFRKEILLFAGLCGLLLLLRHGVSRKAIAVLLCLWLPSMILAHESIFFYIGYYGAAVLLHERRHGANPLRKSLLTLGPPLIASLIAMAFVCLHPGNAKIASEVCSSVQQHGIQECGPAINDLGYSAAQARSAVEIQLRKQNYLLIYIVTGLPALLPLAVLLGGAMFDAKTRADATLICGFAVATLIFSLPLYLYAVDWGRWIYMNIFCMALLVFYADFDHAGIRLPARNVLRKGRLARIVAIGALGIYTVAWTLPHVPGGEPYFGYFQEFGGTRLIHRLSMKKE